MPRQSKVSSIKLKGLRRRLKALELREQGLTYEQIGAELGCSGQRAHRMIAQEYERLTQRRSEKTEVIKKLELNRLDRLLAGHWKAAEGGNVQSLNAVLRIMERRASLLGLDAPKQFQGGLGLFNHLTDEEVAAEAARLGVDGHDELTTRNEAPLLLEGPERSSEPRDSRAAAPGLLRPE